MYTDLKNKLDLLNKDLSHFENSNDICTPMDCVEEMVDKIPNELWEREDISILDPCAGNGNFPAYILTKLKNKFILDCNEINPVRIKNIKKYIKANIIEKDFFEFKDKEYDLIIANPPYALFTNGKRTAKNHSVSKDFVKKSLGLLKENGYLVFIIPDNWMSLSDRNDLANILSNYQFIYLNIHDIKKYFPSVGSSFTYFIVKKTMNKKSFIVKNGYKLKTTDEVFLPKVKNIPLYLNNKVLSIIDKTLNNSSEKFRIETTSYLHKHTKKEFLNNSKTDTFKYKIIHTPSQIVYSKIEHKFQKGYKVFIGLTSYYKVFIDDCGMTQSIAFIRVNDIKEANYIKNILEHPLYVFLNNIHRYGNFNNIRILQKFPIPKNENIYENFNISKDEINLINKFNN